VKIFIVEDDESRIEIFKEKFEDIPEAELFIANTADEGKKILEENKGVMWDMIFLDHDLGDRVYVESADPNTGWQVAKYIRDNGIKYYNVITHSLNTMGAKSIQSMLEGCNHIPFTMLKNLEFEF